MSIFIATSKGRADDYKYAVKGGKGHGSGGGGGGIQKRVIIIIIMLAATAREAWCISNVNIKQNTEGPF